VDLTVLAEIERLQSAPTAELQQRYRELFGEEPGPVRRPRLFRRLAWRLQAVAEGGLSERARQRALEIADEADLRIQAPRRFFEQFQATLGPSWSSPIRHDRRIPQPGTVLSRGFQGRTILVKVLKSGFEYEGQHYRSLSAIASQLTGTRWNGLLFFGLTGRKAKASKRCGHVQQ
jgi:hypothetical protein